MDKIISINPSTSDVIGEVSCSREEEVKQAVTAAQLESGMGRLHGQFGFDEVTQVKLIAREAS